MTFSASRPNRRCGFDSFVRLALIVTVGCVHGAATVAAEPQTPPHRDAPTCLLEQRLFADAADGEFDAFTPLGAALVAGGVDDPAVMRQYRRKAADLARQVRSLAAEVDSPRRRVEIVFNFLHKEVLRGGYDLSATDLRRVFDEGRYNCVSATVLFNYLVGEVGLECRGLELPSHAMSRVLLADSSLDVETTCPMWFDRASATAVRKAATGARAESGIQKAATGGRTELGFQKAAAGGRADSGPVVEVSPIQVAAMVYYNRGVDLLHRKRFAEAAAANAKALRLDPTNVTARGNLLATLNNWSIDLGDAGRYAEAVAVLREGLRIDATFKAFAQNYIHVHRLWIEQLCRDGQYEDALALLDQAAEEMPDQDYLRRAQVTIHDRWMRETVLTESGPLLTMPCVLEESAVH